MVEPCESSENDGRSGYVVLLVIAGASLWVITMLKKVAEVAAMISI